MRPTQKSGREFIDPPLVVELGRRKHNSNDEGEERGVACEGITILVLNEHRNAERYYQNADPHLAEI